MLESVRERQTVAIVCMICYEREVEDSYYCVIESETNNKRQLSVFERHLQSVCGSFGWWSRWRRQDFCVLSFSVAQKYANQITVSFHSFDNRNILIFFLIV